MKKIYFFLAAAFLSADAMAQNVAQTQAAIPSKMLNPTATFALEAPNGINGVAAVGDTINNLYYDFSNPSNWVVGNNSSDNGDWAIGTTGATGGFSASYGQIESTTAANGWAVFDSDGLGNQSSTQDAWVQLANSVDLTGFSNVAVVFQQYHVRYQNDIFLEVSTDAGTTWVPFEVTPSQALNTAGDNPETVSVNISDAISANPSTVWIRFRFVGTWDYAWHVDDVAFVEGASYDLKMVDVYAGIFDGYEYTKIPLSQVTEATGIGGISENLGALDMPNPIYSFEISNSSGVVADSSFAADTNLLAIGSTDTTFFTTGYTPDVLDDYTVTVSVAGDSTDSAPVNNESSRTFSVTESIYAHDDDQNLSRLLTGATADEASPECKFGLFYKINADATLRSIQTLFYNGQNDSTTAESCTVDVYEIPPGNTSPLADLSPVYTDFYDFQPGDISSASSLNLVDIAINGADGLSLTAGNEYVIAVGNPNPGENIVLLASTGDRDVASIRFGPYGVGGAVNWYVGWTTTPLLRMNLDPSVGIQENEDVSDLSLYPNPTQGELRISYTSKEDQEMMFNVYDLNGALKLSQQAVSNVGQKNTIEFDVSKFAAGMYLVQIQGVNSALTRRFVVN